MTRTFTLDKGNAKLMGVCAGFARWADADPTLTRVAVVILALCFGPVMLLAYGAAALIANNG